MIIDALFDVLPRPAAPIEVGDEHGWLRVFRRMGTRLPEDYVQFIKAYGTGIIDEFCWVCNPFSQNENLSLLEQVPAILSSFRVLKAEHPQYFSVPLYFEPNGLLPWGGTIDGDVFCWETSESIDHWPVVVVPRDEDDVELHGHPMTVFLAKVLTGSIKSAAFPDGFPGPSGPRFEPVAYGE